MGDSYRDLIASADTIVDISTKSKHVVDTLQSLEHRIHALSTKASVSEHHTSKEEGEGAGTSSYDKLFALANHVKFIIDTPEVIYNYLDSGEFLSAAQRYLMATDVHRSFSSQSGGSSLVTQRFPLLRHHWPLVKKLGTESWDRAIHWLSSSPWSKLAPSNHLATVLAALALLRPVQGADVLRHLLRSRQEYLVNCLEQQQQGPRPVDECVCHVATVICSTIAQCGELFLKRPGVTRRPLIIDTLWSAGKETKQEQRELDAAARLEELTSDGVALECSQWLDSLPGTLGPLLDRLLERDCPSGETLQSLEQAVQSTLASWEMQLESKNSDGELSSLSHPFEHLPAVEVLKWRDVCQWALGKPVPLWPLLFESPLLTRAKCLIESDFQAANDAVDRVLRETLHNAATATERGPHDAEKLPVSSTNNGDGTFLDVWILQAESLLSVVNDRLDAARLAAVAVIFPSSSSSSLTTLPDHGRAPERGPIASFVHAACLETIQKVVNALEAALQSQTNEFVAMFLGRIAEGLADRSTALRVLLGPPADWQYLRCGGQASQQGADSRLSTMFAESQQRLHEVGHRAYECWADIVSQRLVNIYVDTVTTVSPPLQNPRNPDRSFSSLTSPSVRPVAASAALVRVASGACAHINIAGGFEADRVAIAAVKRLLLHRFSTSVLSLTKEQLSFQEENDNELLLQLLFDLDYLWVLCYGRGLRLLSPGAPSIKHSSKHGKGIDVAVESQRRTASTAREAIVSALDPVVWGTFEGGWAKDVDAAVALSHVLLGMVADDTWRLPDQSIAREHEGSRNKQGAVEVEQTTEQKEGNILQTAGSVVPRFAYLPASMPQGALLQRRAPTSQLVQQQRQSKDVVELLQQVSIVEQVVDSTTARTMPPEMHEVYEGSSSYGFGSLGIAKNTMLATQRQEDCSIGGHAALVSRTTTSGSDEGGRPNGITSSARNDAAEESRGLGLGATALEVWRSSALGSLLGDKAAEMTATLGEYSMSLSTQGGARLLSSLGAPFGRGEG